MNQILGKTHSLLLYHRATSLRATSFGNGLKKEVRRNYFHESTLVSSVQSTICVTIEFLLIFDEANFMEVPISMKPTKFVALEKGLSQHKWSGGTILCHHIWSDRTTYA